MGVVIWAARYFSYYVTGFRLRLLFLCIISWAIVKRKEDAHSVNLWRPREADHTLHIQSRYSSQVQNEQKDGTRCYNRYSCWLRGFECTHWLQEACSVRFYENILIWLVWAYVNVRYGCDGSLHSKMLNFKVGGQQPDQGCCMQ